MAGMVLLKNKDEVLPLKKGTRVAVLGPHFNASEFMLANYHGGNVLVEQHTPLLALLRRQADVEVVAAAAGTALDGDDTSGIDAAVAAAADADVVLLFIGLKSPLGPHKYDDVYATEREGFDRAFVELPPVQGLLVDAVLAAGKPTVAVMINSGGVDAASAYDGCAAVLGAC